MIRLEPRPQASAFWSYGSPVLALLTKGFCVLEPNQAAVLSLLSREVYSIEIVEPLARRATSDLSRLGYGNVRVRHGDGYRGWPDAAPFDAIIVTCAPDHVPQALVDQLKDGGRMVIPVGEADSQELFLLRKRGNQLQRDAVLPVRFVPMTGAADARP